jgi:hypothetical protein
MILVEAPVVPKMPKMKHNGMIKVPPNNAKQNFRYGPCFGRVYLLLVHFFNGNFQ